ncbi:hypothetical protein [Paenalkalicoccus suaedae]|nr:hypothetical protein [Paenalkalicoccus suaedae]
MVKNPPYYTGVGNPAAHVILPPYPVTPKVTADVRKNISVNPYQK